MKKKNQIKVIASAFKDSFTKSAEEYPEYYHERMKHCKVCPFNSVNVEENLSIFYRLAKKLGKENCTICSCFIPEKCLSENECCSLVEIGKHPKWNRLAVETESSHDVNIYNDSPMFINIDLKDGVFYIDCGSISENFRGSLSVRFEFPENVSTNFLRPCSCHGVDYNFLEVDGKNYILSFTFISDSLNDGENEKETILNYADPRFSGEAASWKSIKIINKFLYIKNK